MFKERVKTQESLRTLLKKGGELCLGSQISLVTATNELTLGFRTVWYAPIYVRYNLQRKLIKASAFGTFKLRPKNILGRIFKKSVLHWEETELHDIFHPYTFLLFNKTLKNGGRVLFIILFIFTYTGLFFLQE